jgi:GT2 family glycosyltransferase
MNDVEQSFSGEIAVVVATRGRAAEVAILLEWLARGTRRPDKVVIVGSSPEDWGSAADSELVPVTLTSQAPGLPKQRNVGVRHLLSQTSGRPGMIVFFDDDFRPEAHWLEAAAAVFAEHRDVVGLTGVVLQDGAHTAAVREADAAATVAGWAAPADAIVPVARLYGCNMAVRTAVFDHAGFDERLPLYGWLEDLDFSGQLRGGLVTAKRCAGVHLGSKGARVSGRRYGYSQIVNPTYLARKGTCPPGLATRLVLQALLSNGLRSFRRHPLFDYRGRLSGNVRALLDMMGKRAAPERILDL